ncbi:site-specific integrase [Peptoniphilus sp. GNH]|nr:site-specific integrase [Peptoniphilus sp. GNH]
MKRTKNENGEGSITYQMRNGRKYYTGRYTLGYDTCKNQIRGSISGYNKKEVQTKLKEKTLQISQGLLNNKENLLFGDFFKTWIYTFIKPNVSIATFQKYEADYRLRILKSPLENASLSKLNQLTIRKTLNYWLENCSLQQASQVFGRIKTCLKSAITQKYISTDPTLGVSIKKDKTIKDKYKHFTSEQQDTILKELNIDTYDPKDMLIYIYFASGIRLSEGLALSWPDLVEGGLNINKQYTKHTEISEKGERKVIQELGELKTPSSYRFVPLPDKVLTKLKNYKKLQDKYIKTKKDYKNKNLIFPNQLGDYLDRKIPQNRLNKICTKNNIKGLSIHSIRHTYATRLFENAVAPKVVQSLLGHKSIETTLNIYTHVISKKANEEVNKLNDLF